MGTVERLAYKRMLREYRGLGVTDQQIATAILMVTTDGNTDPDVLAAALEEHVPEDARPGVGMVDLGAVA